MIIEEFCRDWLFIPEAVAPTLSDECFEGVTLPHTNRLFTRLSVDNADYQFASTYRKHFSLPGDIEGQRVFIDFDGVMLVSTIYLNGIRLGVHEGGYTPFSFELTQYLLPGDNLLTVYVDATENPNVPPYGDLVDFLTFGGIYREVRLRSVSPCHIVSAFVRPLDVLTAPRLECDLKLAGAALGLSVEAVLEDVRGQPLARASEAVRADSLTLALPKLENIALWSLECPTLYKLRISLSLDGELVDQQVVRFGFRSAEFRADGRFYLNGEPLKLFGLNRHQTYPYIGAAAPQRLQELDAEIIRDELGCNIVRTSHYAQSPHFLNRCDEIGLLVFEELAGWHHIGGDAWRALALQDLRAMVERDRNHPSIILWGTRINESPDDEDLYGQSNAFAHQLDPTRQTGGVRDFIRSEFLEDVFTLNDFPEGIQTPLVRPHLITEFVGHMFPTKSWDNEERRLEHALRHARKHNLQIGHPDVAGAIGWCAFDYSSHKEFGSGDRICYHGVMDIFRLPKFAAYFYRSQKAPSEEVVLHAATNWTMGDRSGGGNNPLVIFSNCDEVEIFIGDACQGRFQPDFERYPHLAHPPFTVQWSEPYNPWGTPWRDLIVRGCIGGVVAAEQRIDSAHIPHQLRLSANTPVLNADGADMARVAVQVVDKYGNVLPYQTQVVRITLEGDAELIGENPLVLLGGQAACYVKARFTTGEVRLAAQTDSLPLVNLTLQIGGQQAAGTITF
ncbi:MAG: glycoside hydrolase family 2 TIM barrel-domain containing protein [Chloroflexota bacterium]